MKLREALLEMREHLHKAAVYDEILAHLSKVESGDIGIPVDTDDEVVDVAYVVEIADLLRRAKDDEIALVRDIEEMEVDDGESRAE